MKKLIVPFIVAALALTSCNHQEQKSQAASGTLHRVDPVQEFAKLNALLEKYDNTSQTFNVATHGPIKVVGKQGTIIYINPADLETEDGKPIRETVDIELKELTNQSQLLKANAQTVSNGNLLVSGGAYYINVTSGGQKVKLKDGKTYSMQFAKLSSDEMSLYYGIKDSINNLNWKEAGQNFETAKSKKGTSKQYKAIILNQGTGRSDTSKGGMKEMSNEEYAKWEKDNANDQRISEKVYQSGAIDNFKLYQPVVVSQFGWFNCDRPLALRTPTIPTTPITNVIYTVVNNKSDDLYCVNVYMILKGINSLMSSNYYWDNGKIEKADFNNIPIGQSVEFLAVAYQNQKIYAALTDVEPVTANLNEKLTLQEISEESFDKLMNSLN